MGLISAGRALVRGRLVRGGIQGFPELDTLVASPGDRTLRLVIDDGSNILWKSENNVTQPAETTVLYSFALGSDPPVTAPAATDQMRVFCLPDILVENGFRVSTAITGLTGDETVGFVVIQLEDNAE